MPAPSLAIGTLYTFELDSRSAQPAASGASGALRFTASAAGSSLNLVVQSAASPDGSSRPVSVTDQGLCIYRAGGLGSAATGGTSCAPPSPGDGQRGRQQNAIELYFDQEVEFLAYRYGSLTVGGGNHLITWGEPFDPVVSTETLFRKQAGTTYAFENPFIVAANRVITITGVGGGRGAAITEALLSQLEVRALPPSATQAATVPGPLPLFGAGAAFGWSRRLRRRQAMSAPAAFPGGQVGRGQVGPQG
jgi:hypothetical protein